MAKFCIGTAGWSYKDWVGSFYTQQQSSKFDWLQFYSQYFNCVEVNSTYYAYLSPAVVNGWTRKVEDKEDFVFTIKLHQDFTHKRKYTNENIKAVQDNLNILAKENRLGGLLIQFPYSFPFNEVSAQYVQTLNELFKQHSQFVEVRHSSWNNGDVYNFFKQLDISLCTIDQPEIGKAVKFNPILTNEKAYIRFHGRNIEAWKKSINNFGKEQSHEQQSEKYNYLYSKGELTEAAQSIKEIVEKAKEVFVIMNNHPGGKAVVNAFELIQLLEKRINLKMPDTIQKFFAERLKKVFN
jgi:uncharacterized protein YecE (DUF72 family)